MDIIVCFVMCVFLIIGVYQFYFWTQNHPIRAPRSLECGFDAKFPLKPKWVWIYSGLYYPVIILVIVTVDGMREFNYITMSYFLLLFMQMTFFMLYPVATPAKWRENVTGNSASVRLLKLVQHFDKPSNCFPSMHVSVATLTALHLMTGMDRVGYWPLLFPVLIALSALYTKQHYVADLIPGALLGWLAYQSFALLYVPI